jgi:hypothetical protein
MPSIVPSPYPICHIRRITSTELDPDTNDPVIVDGPPVIRRAQGISQLGHRGSSHQVMGVEFLRRVDTEIRVSVDDPSIFGPDDQILLFLEIDQDGAYVKGLRSCVLDRRPSERCPPESLARLDENVWWRPSRD